MWRFLATTAALVLLSSEAHAVRVRVLATTRLEGRADRHAGAATGVVVRGTLRDDVGRPVPDSHVSITFYDAALREPAARLSETPRRCAESGPLEDRLHIAPDEYVIDTDAQGAFCVETVLPIERGTMKLRFAGSSLYEGTAAEIPFDLRLPPVTLAFDPEPSIASLDRPFFSVGLRVTAPNVSKDGWRVVLKDEKDHVLGGAPVDPDGLVRIDVPTDKLGEPGPGELFGSLEGTSLLAPHVRHAIERHARVDLVLAGPEPKGVPEDGIAVEIGVRSSRGPVLSGAVEVALGDRGVGAARVIVGHADLIATFAATRDRSTPASVRYLPDAPWWEPGTPLAIAIDVHAPSPWRRAPAIMLALAVAAFMTRGSWLPRLLRLARASQRANVPLRAAEQPPLEIVKAKGANEGWSGRVVDAHDGRPVEGAIVAIVVPGFPGSQGVEAAASAAADATGHFAFAPGVFAKGALLRVRAPWHATFEQPLPGPSEVSIPMVARRRRLVDRLVAWAAREWGPWHGTREPTPAQVALRARHARDALGAERAAQVNEWARAVEWTAYGRAEVDERAEQSVASLEPSRGLRPKS